MTTPSRHRERARPSPVGGRPTPHTTALDWLREPGPDRRQGGLRRGRVRRLLGAGRPARTVDDRDRVDARQRLPGAGARARRPGGRHGRGSRHAGDAAPGAAGDGRAAAARSAATARRASSAAWRREYYRPEPRARVDARPTRTATHEHGPNGFDLHALSRQPLPLHRLPADPRRRLRPGRARRPTTPLAARRDRPAPAARRRGRVGRTPVRPARRPSPRRSTCSPSARTRRWSPARTDWGVEVNLRGSRAPFVVAVDRLAELRDVRRRRRRDRDRRRAHPDRGRAAARRPGAAAGRAVPAVRLAADPQRRHARRQPRHRLARSATRRPRCSRSRRSSCWRRAAGEREVAAGRLLHRLPADVRAAGRADPAVRIPLPLAPRHRLPQDRQAPLRRHLQRRRRLRARRRRRRSSPAPRSGSAASPPRRCAPPRPRRR